MRWKTRFDARWLRRWTLRLGIAAFVVLAFPVFTVFALISVVGIPLALAMLATPFFFVVFALANLAQRTLRRDGPPAVLASLALALLFLAAVARISNSGLDRRAAAFLAGDLDTLETPLRVSSIGLASPGWPGRGSKGESRCGALCQRLLLSGAVRRVIVADLKLGSMDWTAGTPALSYRLEARESCPDFRLVDHRTDPAVDDAKPEEAMRLAVASGRCLIEEAGTVADAEAVVTTGCVQRGSNDFSAGLSLWADTVTAHRASVHLREQGSFVERYRWTAVSVLRHPVVPVPTLVGGTELNMKPGFLRNKENRHTRDFATPDVDSVRFARDELGLDVTIPVTAATSPAVLIAGGLDGQGPLQPALQQVIDDYFQSFVLAREIDEATRLLAFRALADPRVIAPGASSALVQRSAKAGDAVNAELAGILFARLMAMDPALRAGRYLDYPASYLASAISLLPPGSVLAHRRQLEELARDPARRRRAHQALGQLSVFGADAVQTLLFLVEEGLAVRERSASESGSSARRADPEDWQSLYRSGLTGLCRIGGEASAALPPLLARLRDGKLPLASSTDELLLATLVRLGADPEALRSSLVREDSTAARDRFEHHVERARSKPDCLR